MRGFLRTASAVFLVTVVTPVTCAGLVLATLIFLPLPATIPEVAPGLESRVTHVLDADGNEIATFREFETRNPVAQADIPQVLRDAVVAVEDRNFYEHGGVDLRGTLRALWTDLRSGETTQGGSTITQQYVRNAFEEVGTERTIARKIREAILASQLDRQMDKDEILYRYLDTIYFGEGAYGVGAAAETYFRTPVPQLTLAQAALLAGVIPAPSAYSPRDNPEAAEQKRLIVLDAMLDQGVISPEDHAFAAANPPEIFPPQVQQSARPWFTDYVQRWLETHLPGCAPGACEAIHRGGLTVETTLDPAMQDAADQEVAEILAGSDPTLQMALVAVEPPTGFVRAMVGGQDITVSQVNTALGADGGGVDRSMGSAFKPFVLAEAFEQGIQPDAVYSGGAHDVTEECQGGDFTFRGSSGNQTLRTGMWRSTNTVFTRLILDVGVANAMDMANRLGASMPDPSGYCAAVALGVVGVSPLEMASAYGVFANHGMRAAPTPVLKVTGADGEVIIDNTAAAEGAEQVISAEVADNVTDVLRGVLTDGTAADNGIGRPAAGKTGTAEENTNAAFVGFTPTLSTAVWMGYLDESITLGSAGTGGAVPAATWERFMRRALEDVPPTDFAEPAPIPDVRDEAMRAARGGFDPGAQRSPSAGPPSGGFVEEAPPASVEVPTTTTTTRPTTSTTSRSDTTTTRACFPFCN